MISGESVIALANGFVCADRLRLGANAYTGIGQCKVTKVAKLDLNHQVHIGTEHFSIIVSPDQFFVAQEDIMVMANDIEVGDELFCSTGPEIVTMKGMTFLDSCLMIEVATENGYLVSNGFHLYFGQCQ